MKTLHKNHKKRLKLYDSCHKIPHVSQLFQPLGNADGYLKVQYIQMKLKSSIIFVSVYNATATADVAI